MQSFYQLTDTELKKLLYEEGPVTVALYADLGFSYYSSGVYSGCPSDSYYYINHAVLLVGYDDTEQAWIIKNSWGADWGDQGYIKISYSADCALKRWVDNIRFNTINSNPQQVMC